MKKIVTFLLLAFSIQFAFSAKHVLFSGVPMGGDQKNFVAKLQKKGFQLIDRPEYISDTASNKKYMWGTFKGFSNSVLSISGFRKDAGNVDKVVVMLDVCTSWRSLYDYYSKVKQTLSKDYGQPKLCHEMFHVNGQPKTDDDLFLEVKHGNCEYFSIFSSKRGAVMISIVYQNAQARVLVTYIDKGTVENTLKYNR